MQAELERVRGLYEARAGVLSEILEGASHLGGPELGAIVSRLTERAHRLRQGVQDVLHNPVYGWLSQMSSDLAAAGASLDGLSRAEECEEILHRLGELEGYLNHPAGLRELRVVLGLYASLAAYSAVQQALASRIYLTVALAALLRLRDAYWALVWRYFDLLVQIEEKGAASVTEEELEAVEYLVDSVADDPGLQADLTWAGSRWVALLDLALEITNSMGARLGASLLGRLGTRGSVKAVARQMPQRRLAGGGGGQIGRNRSRVGVLERSATEGETWTLQTRTGRRIEVRPTKDLPAGVGETSWDGAIEYSRLGTRNDRRLAFYHEMVHATLTPKLKPLASLTKAGYQRSGLYKYLEEALAETNAQLRVNGLGGLPDAIRFPIKYGYVSLTRVALEAAGAAIVVGGVAYAIAESD